MVKKVIICDDSRLSALAIQHFLTKNDIFIEATTFNQTDFIASLEKAEKPDFVTMDMILPDGNGIECCKVLWNKWPGMPVIFITADEVPEDKKKDLIHVRHYMLKPIIPDRIKTAIAAL